MELDNRSRATADVTIRPCRESETSRVAALCAEAFGPLTFKGFPAAMRTSDALRTRAEQEILKDVDTQLLRSLKAKNKANREAREFRLSQTSNKMRAEIARLSGQRALASFAPTPLQNSAVRRWRRNRRFACLVACPRDSPETLVGCAVVSMAAPQALLPPPWPSTAPLRCCVSNVAVDDEFRRRGIATKMLSYCEKLAARWGFEDVWLHTEVNNPGAQNLYLASDYQEQRRDPKLFGPFQRILYRKKLQSLEGSCFDSRKIDSKIEGGSSKNGVYVWNVIEKQKDS